MKKNIGITGQHGFVGTHLHNTLGLFPDEFTCVEFERSFLSQPAELDAFVAQCDVIVHLAAVNRHEDQQFIYDENVRMARELVGALERTGSNAHIIVSSSTQEERDNVYGNAKREARELLVNWAGKVGAKVSGLIIPNVFGPFGKPFYNSFIATFCHQLNQGETPTILQDGEVNLIYVQELVDLMIDKIREGIHEPAFVVNHTATNKVSEVLALLKVYTEEYVDRGEIPVLRSSFELNLFNTFRTYMEHHSIYPRHFKLNTDPRGTFVEIIRNGIGGQSSYSTTVPGITRGNHFHTRKIERFAVIKGRARIQLRKVGTEEVMNFDLDGNTPSYVDMPIWYTHNITNVGDEELITIFWINEPYDPSDPDTYFLEV